MVEYYTSLHERLIIDVADSYGTLAKQESTRDVQVLRRRVRSEGLEFLTKTLPKLGKALDRALSQGTPLEIDFFQKKGSTKLPRFLGWLWSCVFSDQGVLEFPAFPRAVRDLRQILYILYKLEVPFTKDQERNALETFELTDLGLPSQVDSDSVISHARNFITSVFGSFDPYDIIPKHGPGAVATGEKNHEKHRFKRFYQAIDRVYPYSEYMVYSLDHLCCEPEYLANMTELESGTAKVVLVPKDSRGPRIISCEPLEYQWIQGGLGEAIKQHLESHYLTKGHVNFTDQGVNRRLALEGSKGCQWVTLDMKEASDRVSVALVKELFRDCPTLLDCLMATRTTATLLPNGRTVCLKKFAPMGSNLCFPVESIVFFALGVGAILDREISGKRVKPCAAKHALIQHQRLVRRVSRSLFVYGDDIIARVEDYDTLLQYFPKVGLEFNRDKCCTAGFFRESCGMDAFMGVPVTPLRLKKLWMSSRKQRPEALLAYVSFSNEMYARGLRSVASFVLDAVEHCAGPLPVLPARDLPLFDYDPDCNLKFPMKGKPGCYRSFTPIKRDEHAMSPQYSILAWIRPYSHASTRSTRWQVRFNSDLQRRELRVLQAVPRRVDVGTDDWCMVLRRFSSSAQRDDLGRFTLTRSVTLKRVWLPFDNL